MIASANARQQKGRRDHQSAQDDSEEFSAPAKRRRNDVDILHVGSRAKGLLTVETDDLDPEMFREIWCLRGDTLNSVGDCAGVHLHNCRRPEEHTSELQSLMPPAYAALCLKQTLLEKK